MIKEELEKKAKQYSSKYARQYYHNDKSGLTTSEEEVCKAYIAGAKENEVVWHDLRKFPNDLPNNNTNVIVKTNSITESAVFHKRLDGTYFWNCFFPPIERHPDSIIAWCELPKFEVEE